MTIKKRDNHHRYFGPYGGRFVPEMLIPALDELEAAFNRYRHCGQFAEELAALFQSYAGRPTPLYRAENLAKVLGLEKVYLKLEGLAHTGAHKINNALGQALLAQKMGKKILIAETGAGQHGLATATVAAKFGMGCIIFMGAVDIKRQYPNVFAMKLLGAEVIPVEFGTRTLKDAVNAALKYWIEHLQDSHYLLGSALGPHPYPTMVREFQSVIGREVKTQVMERENQLPDVLIACVGGGSNAMGLFSPFLDEADIQLYGVEAGGRGDLPGDHSIRLGNRARVGTVQGYRSYFLQDAAGQILPTHSISAGLDYAGIGPELAYLHDTQKISFDSVTDGEALAAFQLLASHEGIIPALESSHAVAFAQKMAGNLPADAIVVVNVSGRGDKDLFITARHLDTRNWHTFLQGEVNDTESPE
jgi:tryptophan synthase beta chain